MKPKTVPYEKKNEPRCSSCGSGQVYTRKEQRKDRIVQVFTVNRRERVCIKCGHIETLKEQK